MQNTKHTAFTLVELIVVITILAILATVAFISFQGYTSSSRDSVRLTDMKSITKSFQIKRTKNELLPIPDKKVDISNSGTIFQYQGELSQDTLKKELNVFNGGLDPLTGEEYGYAVNTNRTKYQLIGFLENTDNTSHNFLSKSFADNTDKYIQSAGTDLGILLDSTTQEIITSDAGSNQIDLQTNTTVFSVVKQNSVVSAADVSELQQELAYRTKPNGSCHAILLNGDAKGDGTYTINPTGVDGEEFEVYCDMKTDGGGWTLFARGIAGQYDNVASAADGILTSPTQPNKARLSTQTVVNIGKSTHNIYQTRLTFENFDDTFIHQWNNGFAGDYKNVQLHEGDSFQQSLLKSDGTYLNSTINFGVGCSGGYSPFNPQYDQCGTLWSYAQNNCHSGFGLSAYCSNRWGVNTTSEDHNHRNGAFWVR